jgi:hypothetical protein
VKKRRLQKFFLLATVFLIQKKGEKKYKKKEKADVFKACRFLIRNQYKNTGASP